MMSNTSFFDSVCHMLLHRCFAVRGCRRASKLCCSVCTAPCVQLYFSHEHTGILQDRKHQHLQRNTTSRNFVIAVDASKTGEKLCIWTLKNIARAGDRLHALHVLPTMSRPHGLQAYAEALLGPHTTPSEAELQQLQHRKHTKLGQRLHALMPTDGAQSRYYSKGQ